MNTISLPPPKLVAAAPVLPACPYQGLMPYTEEDAEFFFGRNRDTRLIIDNLKAYRVTVLYGPSGVGKSSVLHAGVLKRMNDAEKESLATFGLREAVVVYCNNWRDDPLAVLGKLIRNGLSTAFPAADLSMPDRLDARSLDAVCEKFQIDIYLVLDQFEEYFLYHGDDPPNKDFSTELALLIATSVRVNLLIAIREDVFARLDRFEAHVPRLFDNTLRLDYLDEKSARQAVELPVGRYNDLAGPDSQIKIESELVTAVLDQSRAGRVRVGGGDDSDTAHIEPPGGGPRFEAPFLQLVMLRIWSEERARQSTTLQAQTLRDLGGAQTIVRDHLDVVLDHLAPADKVLAAAAFGHLVTPSGTKIAHKPSDLATWVKADEAAMLPLLQLLRDQRILRDVPPPLDDDDESRYEIFHDVLADPVLDWRRRYDAEQQRLEAEQRRRESEVELVREKEAADRAASEARRRLRRSRAVSVVLATLVVVSIISVIVAIQNSRLAIQNSRLAMQKQNMAESAKLLSMNPQAAAAAALKALQTGGAAEAQEALRAALSLPRPSLTLVPPGTGSGAAQWAEMSPGEDLIAAAYNDGTARLFDAHSGEVRHVLETGKASGTSATQVHFSKDGSSVIMSSDDGRARVFDTGDGSLLHELGNYAHPVVAIPGAVGRRNVVLTWASTENPAVWEASSGKMLARLPAPVHVAALSADGTRVLLGAVDGRLRVWTWSNGHVVVDPGAYPGFFDVAFSARAPKRVLALDRGTGDLIRWDWTSERRSQVLAKNQFRDEPRTITQPTSAEKNPGTEVTTTDVVAVTAGKEVRILDSVTGGKRQILPDGDELVKKLAFSPYGRYVARGDNDGTIRVFSAQTGRDSSPALWVFLGHTGAVQSLAFSHDGATLMSAAADGSVRVWPLPNRQVALGTSQPVSDARFGVDGQTIVMGDSRAISTNRAPSFVWRGGTGRGTEQLRSLALSPDSSYVVAATSQSTIPRVFELSSRKEKHIPFKAQATWFLTRVDHSPDPTRPWIAVGNSGGGVEMLNVTTGDLGWASHTGDSVSDVRFSSDGSTVAAASLDGTVRLLDAASGRELRNIHHPRPVTTVAFTTDGAHLATYAEDRHLRIWSTQRSDNRPVADVAVPVRVNSLAFSPDSSRFLALAGSDGSTMVYQWQKQLKPLATLRQHTGSVNAVAFDPKQPAEGPPRLRSASDDGTVALYSCDMCEIGDDQLERYAMEQIGSR
jgi:WD40 repeat protein